MTEGRPMRRFLNPLVVGGLALICGGCDSNSQKALVEEIVRYGYVEMHGPMIVAGIVGASVPNGGIAGLNPFCTEQAWGMWFAKQFPEVKRMPSLFVPPDPERPVKITTSNRT
jgi:hypothetical protein